MYIIQIFDCHSVFVVLLGEVLESLTLHRAGEAASDRSSDPKLPVCAARTAGSALCSCSPSTFPIKMLRHYSLQQKQKLAQPLK